MIRANGTLATYTTQRLWFSAQIAFYLLGEWKDGSSVTPEVWMAERVGFELCQTF